MESLSLINILSHRLEAAVISTAHRRTTVRKAKQLLLRPFIQLVHLLNTYYVLGIGNTIMNKTDKNL